MTQFPTLSGFGPTRRTLHNYVCAISAVARVHAIPQPHWWHTSLKVTPSGLLSDNIPLPTGGILAIRLDFHLRRLIAWSNDGRQESFPIDGGLSGTEMGDGLIAAAERMGLYGEYERDRFESDEPGTYDADAAQRFFAALAGADRAFKKHRARLTGDVGPVQFWPHGFDLSTEWFGTRRESYTENGKEVNLPAQLNLGFYAGEDDDSTYFYSNPWPFETEQLLSAALPEGVSWHTAGWQGTLLPYVALRDDPRAEERLLAFAAAVFDIASPTLLA